MWTILVWNDVEQDFIYAVDDDGSKLKFDDESSAAVYATEQRASGIQARVQYIRTMPTKKAKPKHMRASRIQRFRQVEFAGETVVVREFYNGKAKKISLKKGS